MHHRAQDRRVFILALDGVPFSLLQTAFEHGHCPTLRQTFQQQGTFREIHSVIPPLSTVAWSSFLTGKNPGKHGIFGFVDRTLNPLQTFIPTGRHLKAPTLFERLSDAGKRVITMNVPGTTPPRPIQGVWIADFLTVSLEKAVYPKDLVPDLKSLDYRIDVNPLLAKENPGQFLQDLREAVDRRVETALWLMEKYLPDWDLFMLHIMETDRFLHFFWDLQTEPTDAQRFWSFFDFLDQTIARVLQHLPENAILVSLSDHGFGPVKKEVYVNTWLREQGWLRFVQDPPKGLEDLDSRSKAYSLIPGRFYVNLLGREALGSVLPEDYEPWRTRLSEALLHLKDPDTGAPIVRRVYRREELYHGPFVQGAPDLVALPESGYDFKGTLRDVPLFQTPSMSGMHTVEDAYLFFQGVEIPQDVNITLYDVTATVFALLGVPVPQDLDGRSLLEVAHGI